MTVMWKGLYALPTGLPLRKEPDARSVKPAKQPSAVKFAGNYPDLQGKVAVITGASSGIGLGIAKEFARQGVKVVVNDIKPPEAVEAVMDELRRNGAEALYVQADVTRSRQVDRLIRDAVRHFGKVDILVNNAGIQHVSPITQFKDKDLKRVIDTNLMGAFYATRAAARQMIKQGTPGRIINIASIHALVATANKSAYIMAKHGVDGLTKTAALEWADKGITVNAICPGYVWTPLVERQIPQWMEAQKLSREQVLAAILSKQPINRFIQIEEVANLATFLASADSSAITGSVQVIDGAATAQ